MHLVSWIENSRNSTNDGQWVGGSRRSSAPNRAKSGPTDRYKSVQPEFISLAPSRWSVKRGVEPLPPPPPIAPESIPLPTGQYTRPVTHKRQRKDEPAEKPYISLTDGESSDEDGDKPRTSSAPMQGPVVHQATLQKGWYPIDALLRRRRQRKPGGKRKVVKYWVRWEGHGPEHNSWVLRRHIDADAITEFEKHMGC